MHACLQVGALRGSCVFIGYSALMPDALSSDQPKLVQYDIDSLHPGILELLQARGLARE